MQSHCQSGFYGHNADQGGANLPDLVQKPVQNDSTRILVTTFCLTGDSSHLLMLSGDIFDAINWYESYKNLCV